MDSGEAGFRTAEDCAAEFVDKAVDRRWDSEALEERIDRQTRSRVIVAGRRLRDNRISSLRSDDISKLPARTIFAASRSFAESYQTRC